MRSLIDSASCWSCVMNRKVMPSWRCSAFSSDLHLLAQLQVERAERLVEQQHMRLVDQRARQRHPLALAARQLRRAALADARQSHQGQQLVGAPRALGRGHLAHHQRIGDVVAHAHVREQRVVLEHGVHRPRVGRAARHVFAADQDAPRGRQREAADHAQAGRLARARGPEQREELAGRDRQVDTVDRAHGRRSAAEDAADVFERDGRGHRSLSSGGYVGRSPKGPRLAGSGPAHGPSSPQRPPSTAM